MKLRVKTADLIHSVSIGGSTRRLLNTMAVIEWDVELGFLAAEERDRHNRAKPCKRIIVPLAAVLCMELMTEAEVAAEKEEAERQAAKLAAQEEAKAAFVSPAYRAAEYAREMARLHIAEKAAADRDRKVYRKVNGEIQEMTAQEAMEFDLRSGAAESEAPMDVLDQVARADVSDEE